jgi:nucleotide-binding universal stress UspA family protein
MFGTILLAVDGSAHADRAAELAGKLATSGGDEVIVVHVTEIMVGRAAGPVELDGDREAIERAQQHARELEAAGLPARVELARAPAGHVAKVVVDAAEKYGAGVIVMGSRGRTDLAALVLGSVAHKVLHLSDRPVLIAR